MGWPGAGDLREPNWRTRASQVYGDMMAPRHVRYLEQFREILPGDLVLLPSDTGRCAVHLGVVIPPQRGDLDRTRSTAYYYHFDIRHQEWYENAHRVDVEWARDDGGGGFRSFEVPELGGLWLRGFGRATGAADRARALARTCGLIR